MYKLNFFISYMKTVYIFPYFNFVYLSLQAIYLESLQFVSVGRI